MSKMVKFTSDDKLANWFRHHPPSSETIVNAHEKIRAEFLELAVSMNRLLPECPDKTVALRAIYDAAMKANSVVATTQQLYDGD